MNKVTAITQTRQDRIIEAQRRELFPEIGRFERFGARVMDAAGKVTDLLSGESLEAPTSRLRRNAYRNSHNARVARRIWGGIGSVLLTASSGAVLEVASVTDDGNACEGEQALYLDEGSNLTDLAETISHEYTPVGEVIKSLASGNPDMVGTYPATGQLNLDSAAIGWYSAPTNCDSLFIPRFSLPN